MTELVAETKAIAADAQTTLATAQAFKITSPQSYLEAGEMLKAIKALSRKIDETFDPHIKRAFEAHRALVADKKVHQTPLQTAEALLKRGLLAYDQEEERRRRELEAKAQEEARKEQERLAKKAATLEARGKVEQAAAVAAAAASVVAPIIPPSTPKIAGLSTRTTFRAEVVDKMELIKAVAAGAVPPNALEVNQPFLNNQARAMKETLAYPGVKVVPETGLASRSA